MKTRNLNTSQLLFLCGGGLAIIALFLPAFAVSGANGNNISINGYDSGSSYTQFDGNDIGLIQLNSIVGAIALLIGLFRKGKPNKPYLWWLGILSGLTGLMIIYALFEFFSIDPSPNVRVFGPSLPAGLLSAILVTIGGFIKVPNVVETQ